MKKVKQNKKSIDKGFTLVELIAVIVIISVISIMSFASMTKTIKNSQIKEIEVFETNLKTAAQIYIETNLKDFPQLDDVGGSVQVNALSLVSKGYLDKDIDNPSECSLENSYILAEKQTNNTVKYTVSCVEDADPVYTLDANGTAVYFNPETGTKCTAGEAVSIAETKTGCMKWYAFNVEESSETINLILDHNTTKSEVWRPVAFGDAGQSNDTTNLMLVNNKKAAFVYDPTVPNNRTGPTNLLTQLQTDTSSWAGVPTRTDSYSVINGTANYTINYNTYKARLITAEEVATITGNSSFVAATAPTTSWFYLDSKNQTQTATTAGASNYDWLFDYTYDCTNYGCNIIGEEFNFGYWTATAVFGDSATAWSVTNSGRMLATNIEIALGGVRPVITINKSLIE